MKKPSLILLALASGVLLAVAQIEMRLNPIGSYGPHGPFNGPAPYWYWNPNSGTNYSSTNIVSWQDAEKGVIVSNSVATNGPTVGTLNGLAFLNFSNGTAQQIKLTNNYSSNSIAQPCEIIMLLSNGTPGTAGVCFGNGTTTYDFFFFQTDGTGGTLRWDMGAAATVGTNEIAGAWLECDFYVNGPSSQAWMDGVSVGTLNPGTNSLTTLMFGGSPLSTAYHWPGCIGPTLVYTNALTTAQRSTVCNNMLSAYGLLFNAAYLSNDASGINYYQTTSVYNYPPSTDTVMRVLAPTSPAGGMAHNILIALPVQEGLGTSYGDAMASLIAINAANAYNLTIVEPGFTIAPWYADNDLTANYSEETYMGLVAQWAVNNLETTGTEQIWLVGFSKSGYGGMDLLLKHPTLYTLGAFWDAPWNQLYPTENGDGSEYSYGSGANFTNNYWLTTNFIQGYQAPFTNQTRLWIGGCDNFCTDYTSFTGLLTGISFPYLTTSNVYGGGHNWGSGWLTNALAALYTNSINF